MLVVFYSFVYPSGGRCDKNKSNNKNAKNFVIKELFEWNYWSYATILNCESESQCESWRCGRGGGFSRDAFEY